MTTTVPMFDARQRYDRLKPDVDAAIARVLASGRFIHGPEHAAFEQEFAAYCESQHAVGVANGTDALRIALVACGVRPGDEVITVANAGVPPIAAIVEAGATPRFADVDPATRNLDPAALAAAITSRTRAVVAVHLYGHPVDVDAILAVTRPRGIKLIEDCAQAHGARYKGRRVGGLGDAAGFSFYPTKNLGAYGDGGCVVTNDADIADRARMLRGYGWRTRYVSESHGFNSRLDELQAAILRVLLRHLDEGNEERRAIARAYTATIDGVVAPPTAPWAEPVYHLYVVESPGRDRIKAALADQGISTDLHYPLATHLQQAYQSYGDGPGSLPNTERLCGTVLSLPVFPELTLADAARVAGAVSEAARSVAVAAR
ncbi:MAG: DegT/DnrJ/EryC1/StrS family aminotransferase [Chloroflexota bacterium]